MKYILILLLSTLTMQGTTLNQLIDYATKHSTTIKKSQLQSELAESKRDASRMQKYGEINLLGDYTHYNTPRTLAPLTPSTIATGKPITTTKDLFSVGIAYSVPLFTGFAHTRQIEIDDIATKMSETKQLITKEQLVYNIRSLYLTILAQQETLRAQQTYIATLAKLQKQIAYEVKLGKKAKIDLLIAESDTTSSRTKQEILKSNIETTKATLSSLVGKKVSKLSKMKIKIKKPNYSIGNLSDRIYQLAKVRVEEMALQKADKAIAKSKSAKLPQVNMNSYIGKNYGEDLTSNEWKDETLWQVGVSVKYNLVDFGKRDNAVQQATIAKMQAALDKEQTLLDLKKLLAQGVEKIKQSYAEYQGNASQLRLSKQSEKIERVRYKNNVITLNDLLLAKSKKQLAYARLIESKYNYQKSIYYLDYLLEQGADK